MMGHQAEDPSPFGSMMAHNIDDEAQDLAGAMLTADNTINVLDSPFASSCIHDDLGTAAKCSNDKVSMSQDAQPINSVEKSSGSTAATVSSGAGSSLKGFAADANNGSVASILESPFSITQLETMKLEGHLSDAAAADALTSATAAVSLDSSKNA